MRPSDAQVLDVSSYSADSSLVLNVNLFFLAWVLDRQRQPKNREIPTREQPLPSPERTTVKVTPQPEGPGDYIPPTARIAAPTAATPIL
jgi:hypothetical protein